MYITYMYITYMYTTYMYTTYIHTYYIHAYYISYAHAYSMFNFHVNIVSDLAEAQTLSQLLKDAKPKFLPVWCQLEVTLSRRHPVLSLGLWCLSHKVIPEDFASFQ